MLKRLVFCMASWSILLTSAWAETVVVRDAAGLKRALSTLSSGTILRIAPGEYSGGHDVNGVQDLTVEALDVEKPPHFKGGNYAWHFSNCAGLKLRHLLISGQSRNGLNLDDGGNADRPMNGVTLEHIDVKNIGPKGNCDGIKCSGLDDLTIKACSVEAWGGQGIDLVGCHHVLISESKFIGKPGYSATSGVQCKGGSEAVTIEKCHFNNAGQRPINAGGSTGLAYFRPAGAKYEARKIIVKDNEISGSLCACAFTGVDDAEFTGNTILFPEKWVFRILQETTEEGFAPCRNVLIENNAIVFRRSQVGVEVNIGAKTAPETFRFAKNHWFAEDRPERSKPQLPTVEKDGKYGIDPRVPK